jgi:hypothetical protein
MFAEALVMFARMLSSGHFDATVSLESAWWKLDIRQICLRQNFNES